MKTILTTLMMLAIATPLFAGEAEQANAKAFLDAQTKIDEAVLGEQTLKFRVLGISIGTMNLKIEAGEFEGTKCYVVTTSGEFEMGVKNTMKGKSYIAANLALLSADETEATGGKVTEHSVCTLKDGVITAVYERPTAEDESERKQTYTIKAAPGLLIGGAEMLVTALLPQDAGKKYEFTRWSSTGDEVYAITIEAVGKEDVDGKSTFRFTQFGKKYDKDPMGGISSKDVESALWYDGRKLVRMQAPEGFVLDNSPDAKLTPITREMIDKREDKVATAAGFFLAANNKDEELLKMLLNEEKIVRASLDVNPMTQGLSNEEKDALAKQYAPMVLKQILEGEEKSEDDQARDKAVAKLLLHTENFEAIEKDGKQIVRFNEATRKFAGDVSFVVAKDADGKWEIVEIVSGGTEDEADEPETPKKEGDKGEEEEGF